MTSELNDIYESINLIREDVAGIKKDVAWLKYVLSGIAAALTTGIVIIIEIGG